MTDHKRLTDEELAEIRKRAQRALDLNPFNSLKYFEVSGTIYNEDIPRLLAEIERLKKERKELWMYFVNENEDQDDYVEYVMESGEEDDSDVIRDYEGWEEEN